MLIVCLENSFIYDCGKYFERDGAIDLEMQGQEAFAVIDKIIVKSLDLAIRRNADDQFILTGNAVKECGEQCK